MTLSEQPAQQLYPSPRRLAGTVALVTGAASGITPGAWQTLALCRRASPSAEGRQW